MTRDEATRSIGRSDSRQDVLNVLADPTSRAILQLISEQTLTATEVAEKMDVPPSTVYRKLDQLIDTPLVEATYRLKSDGKHPRQYQCTVDRVRIQMADMNDGMLQVYVSEPSG